MIQNYRFLTIAATTLKAGGRRRDVRTVIGSKMPRMRQVGGRSGHCIMSGFSGFPVSSGRREEIRHRCYPLRSQTDFHPHQRTMPFSTR
ncbi:hypothetical protein CDAR_580351 [Caerostris darwini]|uniref:Uncharacterized protein n=1 Tax=Caerostris darwini TaxID=1538125 RepID=A0AAV4RCN8_9ARAC|nr:hypothetical protein CDAR_580351 [Caerostris darwini]